MSATNGATTQKVFKIGRKGMATFQMERDDQPDGPPVELDVIATQNLWFEIDRSFRDDKGEIQAEKFPELNQALWAFARDMLQCPDISLANAKEFLKVITEEGERLRHFFEIKFDDAPSSRESTDVHYST